VIELGCRDADVELSELGREQARALRRTLAGRLTSGPVAVYSSPYARALSTAHIALGSAEVPAPALDERLRDRELGILDRLTTHGVRHRYPSEAARRRELGKLYYRPPGGESWSDVALRLRSFLRDALAAIGTSGTVVVFSHDAVIALLRYVCIPVAEKDLLDLAARVPVANASITELRRSDGHWLVVRYADQSHLIDGPTDLRTVHPGEPDVRHR
jgi:broad specificity phosphatase PhoE